MRQSYKTSIICLILVLTTIVCKSQALSIEETIKYINNKLRANPDKVIDGLFMDLYQIAISNKGQLIVYKYTYFSDAFPNESPTTIEKALISKIERKYFSECSETVNGVTFVGDGTPVFVQWNNDNLIGLGLCNAFNHLFNLVISDPKYSKKDPNDPFAFDKKKTNQEIQKQKNIIKFDKGASGLIEISTVLNGVLKINFIFDSGASEVSISPDVALTLIKTGTVKDNDFIESREYQFADGSKAKSKRFIIRKIEIGGIQLENIPASISNSISAPMLIGQNVIEKLGKVVIDNENKTLTIKAE
jgi:hypothetical protein